MLKGTLHFHNLFSHHAWRYCVSTQQFVIISRFLLWPHLTFSSETTSDAIDLSIRNHSVKSEAEGREENSVKTEDVEMEEENLGRPSSVASNSFVDPDAQLATRGAATASCHNRGSTSLFIDRYPRGSRGLKVNGNLVKVQLSNLCWMSEAKVLALLWKQAL